MIKWIMTKFRIAITSLSLYCLLSNPVLAATNFSDVSNDYWAYNAIQSLSQSEIVKGFPDGTFKPDRKITREQFAIVLVKALNIPLKDESRATQIFWDIDDKHRSFLYIDAAKPYIPVSDPKGYAFNFYPDKFITRQEVAHAVVRALKLNEAPKPDSKYLASKFKDYQNIAPEYRDSVALAGYYNVLSGNSKGMFSPRAPLSRAELCAIMNVLIRNDSSQKDGFKLPHKPWIIEFVNFDRPDYDMVRDFPDYNKTQSFYGKVTEIVPGINNSYFVVEFPYEDDKSLETRISYKTVNVFVPDKEINLFKVGDWVTFNYDRNNNILSYASNNKTYDLKKTK